MPANSTGEGKGLSAEQECSGDQNCKHECLDFALPEQRDLTPEEQKALRRVYAKLYKPADSALRYSPDFWEYRQISRREDYEKFKWGKEQRSYVFSLRMAYFFDGTGIALEHDYWAGKVRYFSFAVCEHKEREQRNVGNCLNEYTCVACGYKETIDSSG